jgi:hypothetical protein
MELNKLTRKELLKKCVLLSIPKYKFKIKINLFLLTKMSNIKWKIINFITMFLSKNSDKIVKDKWDYEFSDIKKSFKKKYPDIKISKENEKNMQKQYNKMVNNAFKFAFPPKKSKKSKSKSSSETKKKKSKKSKSKSSSETKKKKSKKSKSKSSSETKKKKSKKSLSESSSESKKKKSKKSKTKSSSETKKKKSKKSKSKSSSETKKKKSKKSLSEKKKLKELIDKMKFAIKKYLKHVMKYDSKNIKFFIDDNLSNIKKEAKKIMYDYEYDEELDEYLIEYVVYKYLP